MKILVIPDVHLKPYMFFRASEIMKDDMAERCVCLMDLADDWNRQFNLELYRETYDAAISFAKEYPDTLWCWGNHDICYIWDRRESGYSPSAAYLVRDKIHELQSALAQPERLAFIHRIDDVLFSHGGLAQKFADTRIKDAQHKTIDEIINEINRMGDTELWNDMSPLWLRPQSGRIPLFKSDEYLQVVGHTPVSRISCMGSLVSADVFSTYSSGENIGTCEYLIIDTKTKKLSSAK